MVVYHNDILNAIARARNIRHLLAENISERWLQGEEATSEQTESLIQLGDWIGFLTDAEQLIVEDCIDSDDVWNIIQQINEQAVGLDCTGTDLSYLNLPPAPAPNVYNYVESVTGLNTNNADPQHPVVRISVDGVTVTGQGTPASPLVSPPSGVQSVTDDGNGVVSVDNTDPVNPIVEFNGVNVDGLTITGDGTTGNPLTAIGGGGGSQNLQQVTTLGATTTDTIIVENPSNSNSSVSPIEVRSNDLILGTSAYLDSGGILGMVNSSGKSGYIKNDIAITGNVALSFPNKPTGTYVIATTADITSGVTSVSATAPITSSGGTTPTISTLMNTNKLIGRSTAGTGVMEEITVGSGLSLSAGTLTATGGGGGIPFATASGTDTYTATVSPSVITYADGDAYLIRFTNGNTDASTLNINTIGAKTLYRNNDGIVIGGDIWAGAEMLCVYNSLLNGFQCIGTSPNSLFAYVVNADSVTINRGQPVFAFGSTGNRMSVKLANNSTDATSAQTYGLVYSTSIAAGQKGIMIIQGVLDGLNLGGTWNDGDPVYLGATAGTLTKTKPYAPNHLVYLGVVERANAGNGIMYVRVQNGYELDELHNVQAQNPTLKDTLWYDNTVSPAQWKTASISTILGYTPQPTITGAATTITTSDLTASRALASDGSGKVAVSSVTSIELGYVSGVTSAIQTQIDTKTNKLITTNRQTASYILALSDADKLVEMNVGSANTLTVPLNSTIAFPIGTQILIAQYGAGQTTVTPATVGVTIRSNGGKTKLNGQYSGATLIKIATDEWYLFGDITV